MHISLKVFICLILSMALVWARSSEVPDAFVEPACDVTLFVPQVTPGTKTEVMVPMRDCVELATNVYLPRNPGPFPALLIRLPYDKNRGMKEFPHHRGVGLSLPPLGIRRRGSGHARQVCQPGRMGPLCSRAGGRARYRAVAGGPTLVQRKPGPRRRVVLRVYPAGRCSTRSHRA